MDMGVLRVPQKIPRLSDIVLLPFAVYTDLFYFIIRINCPSQYSESLLCLLVQWHEELTLLIWQSPLHSVEPFRCFLEKVFLPWGLRA